MKFRVEMNVGGLKEEVVTRERHSQGLEAPETYWVELQHYPKHLPPPKPEDIVYETIAGQRVAGVFCFDYDYDCVVYCMIKFVVFFSESNFDCIWSVGVNQIIAK